MLDARTNSLRRVGAEIDPALVGAAASTVDVHIDAAAVEREIVEREVESSTIVAVPPTACALVEKVIDGATAGWVAPQSQEEKQRGLEPDECYCRDADGEIPDIALEVVKTHGAIDKLEVYRGLGIREVWVLEKSKFRILTLSEGAYVLAPRSAVLPEVDLDRIAVHAQEVDQHTALKAFRDELRATAK